MRVLRIHPLWVVLLQRFHLSVHPNDLTPSFSTGFNTLSLQSTRMKTRHRPGFELVHPVGPVKFRPHGRHLSALQLHHGLVFKSTMEVLLHGITMVCESPPYKETRRGVCQLPSHHLMNGALIEE